MGPSDAGKTQCRSRSGIRSSDPTSPSADLACAAWAGQDPELYGERLEPQEPGLEVNNVKRVAETGLGGWFGEEGERTASCVPRFTDTVETRSKHSPPCAVVKEEFQIL